MEVDGHDIGEIIKALDEADGIKGKPTVIIAHTIKGKGISFAENVAGFHNGAMTKAQYAQALRKLTANCAMQLSGSGQMSKTQNQRTAYGEELVALVKKIKMS